MNPSGKPFGLLGLVQFTELQSMYASNVILNKDWLGAGAGPMYSYPTFPPMRWVAHAFEVKKIKQMPIMNWAK